MTHTPGTWKIGDTTYPRSVWGVGEIPVYADLPNGHWQTLARLPGTGPVTEANARLIAAAPDLLAACRIAAEYSSLDGDDSRAIRAAIAKAEGR